MVASIENELDGLLEEQARLQFDVQIMDGIFRDRTANGSYGTRRGIFDHHARVLRQAKARLARTRNNSGLEGNARLTADWHPGWASVQQPASRGSDGVLLSKKWKVLQRSVRGTCRGGSLADQSIAGRAFFAGSGRHASDPEKREWDRDHRGQR